jgi:hypothetical protein
MIEPSLALQATIRNRLIADAALVALVPPESIADRSRRPECFPSIIMGEGQTIRLVDTFDRTRVRCFADLHVWTREQGTVAAKQIAGAVADALAARFYNIDVHRVIDLRVASTRFMRDPAGLNAHAVISIEALLELVQ